MDRVETLLQKLQEQFKQGAAPDKLLLTVQMMQHELVHLQSANPQLIKEAVSVSMPVNNILPAAEPVMEELAPASPPPVTQPAPEPVAEERTVEVLQVDEAEVEAELEEIRRNAALMQQISGNSKPPLLFDMHQDEIPTLAQQQTVQAPREVNDTVTESATLNDILKTTDAELGSKLTDTPVKDLKKAIGINDRFLYINELFRGDEVMYERSIKTINSFSIWPEAEYWIRRELKTKLGWIDSDTTVQQFDQLVKRRFA